MHWRFELRVQEAMVEIRVPVAIPGAELRDTVVLRRRVRRDESRTVRAALFGHTQLHRLFPRGASTPPRARDRFPGQPQRWERRGTVRGRREGLCPAVVETHNVDPLALLQRGGAGVEEIVERDGRWDSERDGDRMPEELVVSGAEYGVVQGGTRLAGVQEVPDAGTGVVVGRDEPEDGVKELRRETEKRAAHGLWVCIHNRDMVRGRYIRSGLRVPFVGGRRCVIHGLRE